MSTSQQAVLRRKKMRGGLGRTLLTAFLLLALGPLSVMSVYAINRTYAESHRQQDELLNLLAKSYQSHFLVAGEQLALALEEQEATAQWTFNKEGQLLDSNPSTPLPNWFDSTRSPAEWQIGGTPLALWVSASRGEDVVAATLSLEPLLENLSSLPSLDGTTIYLQQDNDLVLLSANTSALTESEINKSALIRIPIHDLTLLVVPPANNANPASEELATTLVAAALVVALITTIAAALITRRITRPIYDLTQAVVKIARGDIQQRVQVKRENELGILALAFNTMVNRLHNTLETLEERVRQRTKALQVAHDEMATRARGLELTAEIGATMSNIHDLDTLLAQGTTLIGTSFDYKDVAVWLLGHDIEGKVGLTLQASSQYARENKNVPPVLPNAHTELAQKAFQLGSVVFDESRQSAALPLRLADNVFGSFVLTNSIPFEDGTVHQQQLQILADAFAVALENARALEMERAAWEKLKRLESHRTQFLGEMSHELSTALNSIIGFSHLMLREVETPLTDTQRSDLTYINRNGLHLLSLLDGLLDVIDHEQRSEELSQFFS